MVYVPIKEGQPFKVAHLTVTAIPVNHIVPTVGVIISDGKKTVAFSSDTSETDEFWQVVNKLPQLDAVLIEASFPDSMAKLAEVSRHFTPGSLAEDCANKSQRIGHPCGASQAGLPRRDHRRTQRAEYS